MTSTVRRAVRVLFEVDDTKLQAIDHVLQDKPMTWRHCSHGNRETRYHVGCLTGVDLHCRFAPFGTIAEAMKAARGGDVIVVRPDGTATLEGVAR